MQIFSRLTLLLLFFGFSQQTCAQALDAQTVLDQLIQTYGGENNLRKMDNMIQEWDLTALMGNRHGTDTRIIRAPDQLRVDLDYSKKSETRILNGDTAHVIFKDVSAQQVTGMQRDAMRLQIMRMYSPLMLRNKIDSVSVIEQGGMLALSLVEKGMHVYYMINKDNWHIEKVAGSLLTNGNEVQFLTEYSDFAIIEGVLVHQKENKYAAGMNTAVLELRKITFDAKIEDRQFIYSPLLGGQNITN